MGTHRSSLRIKIDKADLVSLLENNSLKDIAKMYDCSIALIHTALTEQIKKNKIGLKKEKEEIDEMKIPCHNAWKELKSTELYQELIN